MNNHYRKTSKILMLFIIGLILLVFGVLTMSKWLLILSGCVTGISLIKFIYEKQKE